MDSVAGSVAGLAATVYRLQLAISSYAPPPCPCLGLYSAVINLCTYAHCVRASSNSCSACTEIEVPDCVCSWCLHGQTQTSGRGVQASSFSRCPACKRTLTCTACAASCWRRRSCGRAHKQRTPRYVLPYSLMLKCCRHAVP